MARLRWLVGTLLLGSVTGCSSSGGGGGGTGSGTDASVSPTGTSDAGEDATTIFGTDAGHDAGGVSSSDAGEEAGLIDAGSSIVSATALDFGLVSCGSAATAQTLTVVNPTTHTATWSASLGKGSASAFQLSATSGTLAAQQSTQVTVTPSAVPAVASTAANAFGDVATVTVDDTSVSVGLTETAQGAVLGFEPASVPFGPTPLSAGPESLFFAVQNSGNLAANVTLTLTGDPSFSLTGGTTTQTLAAPAGNVTDSQVVYTPTATTSVAGSIALALDGSVALCGPLPTALGVSGTGTNGQVSVSPPSILFGNAGLVPCGTTATAATVTVSNSGSAPFNWTAALTHGGSFYTVSPASGTIVVGGPPTTLTVTPKTIPATSATTAGEYDDTLTVTTNVAGDTPHVVALNETAQGAIVARSTGTLGFGSIGVGATVTNNTTLTFSNTGNVDATLVFTNGSPSIFAQTSPLTIAAGTFAPEVVSFTPGVVTSYTDLGTVALAAQDDGGVTPLCSTLPTNLTLTGSGATPALGASPNTLNFGFIPCGQAGTKLTTTITNNAQGSMFTASVLKGAGSYFGILPPTGPTVTSMRGSIGTDGTVQITIVPKAIPMPGSTASNFYGDTLQVVTDTGYIVDVALNQTALGAVLSYSKASLAFSPPSVTSNSTANLAFTVSNGGTAPANVTLAMASGSSPAYGVSPTSVVSIPASGAGPSTAIFTPPSPGTYTGAITMTVSSDTLLCAALPANVTLTGTGN